MPNYSFKCTNCGHEFDKVVPLADYNDVQDCPKDLGPAERQLTSAPGTAFKGAGWTPRFYR